MKVSIVITNFNGQDILACCLPEVVRYAEGCPCVDEVVLVENGSSDGSYDYARTVFPEITIVRVEKNRGFAPGANAGFRAARNPRLLLLSNDMVPARGCVELLLPHLDDKTVFATTARQLDSQGNLYLGASSISVKWGMPQAQWGFNLSFDQDASQPITHFGGGISLYNREYLLELGGFDEELLVPFYVEDEDLFYRAWKRGFTCTYEPRACVYHHHQHASAIVNRYDRKLRLRIERRNRFLYAWKNIHDRRWFACHLARTFMQLLVPERTYHGAWTEAVKALGEVLRKRSDEKRASRRSDPEAVAAIRAKSPFQPPHATLRLTSEQRGKET